MANTLSDELVGHIFSYLDNPIDRRAVSEVSRQWRKVDSETRTEVHVANCYSVAPRALSRRFPGLNTLKIRGMPRAADFGLMLENWGGYAEPWVQEVARAYGNRMKSLWLRRMDIKDADLRLLSECCSESLIYLRLHKCFGFSTAGLAFITLRCRSLKVLSLQESTTLESDMGGTWLRHLAESNPNLEELNFLSLEGQFQVNLQHLELLIDNCPSLRSLKVNHDIDILEMRTFLSRAPSLSELGTGSCGTLADLLAVPMMGFRRTVTSLCGLFDLADDTLPFTPALLGNLKSLDLQYCALTQAGVSEIVRHCTSLEILTVTDDSLGDDGLVTIAGTCRDLKKIVVNQGLGQEGAGIVTPRGIIPLVRSCVRLEHLVMYVTDLDNRTLAAVGQHCPQLKDCRFVLLDHRESLVDLPLDDGVKSLLQGCQNLRRFALFVRHGALTDIGMNYIGMYGERLRWILLGRAGQTDGGMLRMATGCRSLEKLEIRDCPVTERGLGDVARFSNRLKFIWAQGDLCTENQGRELAGGLRNWVVEFCTALEGAFILAYSSLVGPRTDHPRGVTVLPSDGDYQPFHGNGGN